MEGEVERREERRFEAGSMSVQRQDNLTHVVLHLDLALTPLISCPTLATGSGLCAYVGADETKKSMTRGEKPANHGGIKVQFTQQRCQQEEQ